MIRRYINQGNDVTSAAQMKEAVQKEGKCKSDIKIKVVNGVNVIDGKQGKTNIPLISKLYNFVYEVEGLRMWKAYNIGEGKLIPWDSLPCPQEVVELQIVIDWNQGESRVVEIDTGAGAEESTTKALMCPIEHCTKQFATQKAVDDHILLGNCTFDGKERMSVAERAKYVYAHKIISLYPSDHQEATDVPIVTLNCCNCLQMGWGLKEVKPRATFTTKQKYFIVAKFNIGKTTGNKVDPFNAAEEMRLSGNFKRDEFLSGQQISSYFSRLAAQDKKTSDLDYVAALDEDKKQRLLKIENCIAGNQL